jgi:hypothetical protein
MDIMPISVILFVFSGSLAHSVTDFNTLLAGASGGCYAILGAHFAIIIMVSDKVHKTPVLLINRKCKHSFNNRNTIDCVKMTQPSQTKINFIVNFKKENNKYKHI